MARSKFHKYLSYIPTTNSLLISYFYYKAFADLRNIYFLFLLIEYIELEYMQFDRLTLNIRRIKRKRMRSANAIKGK